MTIANDKTEREQWAVRSDEHRTDFAPVQKPFKYQAAAWALWVAGIALAFGGALTASGALDVPLLSDVPVLTVALMLVAGLAIVLTAQRMWKKAAALQPSKKQGVLGVVMACFAFAPMCLFFVLSKNAPGSTKAAAVASAAVSVALIVALCWLMPADPLALYAPEA